MAGQQQPIRGRVIALLGMLFLLGWFGWRVSRQRDRLVARLFGLPAPQVGLRVERDLPITMPDGVTLYADHYLPQSTDPLPTILIRSPYGRASECFPFGNLFGLFARQIALQGYHVLFQTTRGRFASEGEFVPFLNERADGQATIAWIEQQPWFNGQLGMWGPSYLGYTQWAAAIDAPAALQAISPSITASRFSRIIFPQEGLFQLELSLRWIYGLAETSLARRFTAADFLRSLRGNQREAHIQRGLHHLPIDQADRAAWGVPLGWYRRWMESTSHQHPDWQASDHFARLGNCRAPAHLVGGWYDIALRELLNDYAALLAAGQNPYLTIGPHHHNEQGVFSLILREGLTWFDAQLKGDFSRLRHRPVRLFVMGANEWHEMDFWPPPARMQRLFLQSGGQLAPTSAAGPPAQFTYRATDPTPNLGGPLLLSPRPGRQLQATLEARPDLLCFTSEPLSESLDIIGHIRAEIYLRADQPFGQLVARLCHLLPTGESFNLCDGVVMLRPDTGELQADGSRRIEVDLWATAQRFAPGDCLRLQICGSAFPRWIRPLAAPQLSLPLDPEFAITYTILCDDDHPSALVLPVVTIHKAVPAAAETAQAAPLPVL